MRHFLLLGLALAAASPAQAQYGAFDMGALANTLSQDHVTKSEESRARQTARPAPMSRLTSMLARQTNGATVAAAPSVAADFAPTSAVRERLATIMADGSERLEAGSGAKVRALVESGVPLNEYNRIAPQMGLRTNDAIDAFAFYLIAQWVVANNYQGDVSAAQVAGVRRQAANAYATVADSLGTDAKRQEFGEMLAMQGAMMLGGFKTAMMQKNDAMMSKLSNAARQGGRVLFTAEPTDIRLTDQGFRKSNRVGAAEPGEVPAQAGDAVALADNNGIDEGLGLAGSISLVALGGVISAGLFAFARHAMGKA